MAVHLLRAYIQKKKLMQSELYKNIFAEGEQKGIQQAITDLCEILGIEMTAERRAQIERLDLAGLSALRAHIKTARAWLPSG